MIHVVTKEINRVYKLFIERNPYFLKNNGQVTIVAHSLGVRITLQRNSRIWFLYLTLFEFLYSHYWDLIF
jgi:hypothetical protein